ncbi:MAG: TraB/GumN family protein [Sphingomonas sp.]|nr:TraB/GumN family protein [Sphingomonas sp.]
MRIDSIWARLTGAFALILAWCFQAAPALAQDEAGRANAVTAPAATASAPRPAIWLLSRGDTKIYLFGTVHILPPELQWRSAALDRVIGEADELVLEIAADEMEQPDPAALQAMMLGKTAPLEWRVSPNRRAALRAMVADSGLQPLMLDQMQTWAATMTLSVAQLVAGHAEDGSIEEAMANMSGAEDALTAAFRERGKPISGVETVGEQMSFFGSMSFTAQREMLEEMVDAHASGAGAAFDPNESGWVSGDVESIAEEMRAMNPDLYDALLTRRNAAWTDWLIARLERPGTVLFAVGAGHLAGEHSVQAMLEARGFTVARID